MSEIVFPFFSTISYKEKRNFPVHSFLLSKMKNFIKPIHHHYNQLHQICFVFMFSLCRWENALAVNYLDVAAVCIYTYMYNGRICIFKSSATQTVSYFVSYNRIFIVCSCSHSRWLRVVYGNRFVIWVQITRVGILCRPGLARTAKGCNTAR